MSSTVDRGEPVEGCICPGCAHVDKIVEETTTRPLEAGDVLAAALMGWFGAVAVLSGRTTKRLRCLRCGCRFARPTGFFSRMFWWTVVGVLAVGAFGAVAAVAGSAMGPASLPSVSQVCTELAARPLIALALVFAVLAVVFFAAMIGYTNAEAERQHLYKALLKRDQGIVFYDDAGEAAAR